MSIWKIAIIFFVLLQFLSGCNPGPQNDPDYGGHSTGKSVILIILDTLRADHLSCYGYRRNTSPTIDSLAENGTLWLNALSQAPWTLPSHASIWTGLSVRAHGTNHIGGIAGIDLQLDTHLPSLPSVLQEAGYQTAGFTNFVLLSEGFGFNHGFDWYDCDGSGERTAATTVDAFLVWLDGWAEIPDFFCVIHLFDIHAPYNPAPPYDTVFAPNGVSGITGWEITEEGEILNRNDLDHLIDMYDSEILYVDNELRRLFQGLEQRGIADSTFIIITSDHGEEFLEHDGVGHGHALYQEQIHVPLIFSGPGVEAGRVSPFGVALFDIMPTVISYLNLAIPAGVEGVDILSPDLDSLRAIPSGGISPDRFFLALTPLTDFQSCAVIEGFEKVIAYMGTDRFIQFDLEEDPGEAQPYAADSIMIEKALYHWATPLLGNPAPVDGTTEDINNTLRDLGYIR